MSVTFAAATKGFQSNRFPTDGSAASISFDSNTDFNGDLELSEYDNANNAAGSENRVNVNFNTLPFSEQSGCAEWHTELQYQLVFRFADHVRENKNKHDQQFKRSKISHYPAFEEMNNIQQANFRLACMPERSLKDILGIISIMGVGLKAKNLFEKTAQGHYLTKQPFTVEGHVEMNDIFSSNNRKVRETDQLFIVLRKVARKALKFTPSYQQGSNLKTNGLVNGKLPQYTWQLEPVFSDNGVEPDLEIKKNDETLEHKLLKDHPDYSFVEAFREDFSKKTTLPTNKDRLTYRIKALFGQMDQALTDIATNVDEAHNKLENMNGLFLYQVRHAEGELTQIKTDAAELSNLIASLKVNPNPTTLAPVTGKIAATDLRLKTFRDTLEPVFLNYNGDVSSSYGPVQRKANRYKKEDETSFGSFTKVNSGADFTAENELFSAFMKYYTQFSANASIITRCTLSISALPGVKSPTDFTSALRPTSAVDKSRRATEVQTFLDCKKKRVEDYGHVWRIGYVKEIKAASHYREMYNGELLPNNAYKTLGTNEPARVLTDARSRQMLVVQLDLTGKNNIMDEYLFVPPA
jgi:hypothetical protein